MHVAVDEPGDQQPARAVDTPGTVEPGTDLGDPVAVEPDVRASRFAGFGVEHPRADEQRHASSLR